MVTDNQSIERISRAFMETDNKKCKKLLKSNLTWHEVI